jgi:hypothetical protein
LQRPPPNPYQEIVDIDGRATQLAAFVFPKLQNWREPVVDVGSPPIVGTGQLAKKQRRDFYQAPPPKTPDVRITRNFFVGAGGSD